MFVLRENRDWRVSSNNRTLSLCALIYELECFRKQKCVHTDDVNVVNLQ